MSYNVVNWCSIKRDFLKDESYKRFYFYFWGYINWCVVFYYVFLNVVFYCYRYRVFLIEYLFIVVLFWYECLEYGLVMEVEIRI